MSAGTRHATRDGTGVRDYVHVWDVARAHLLALSATANPPALFNVASGKGVSVREFVEACIKVTGVKFKVVEVVEARPGDCAEVRVCSSCFIFFEYLDVRVVGFCPLRPGDCAQLQFALSAQVLHLCTRLLACKLSSAVMSERCASFV